MPFEPRRPGSRNREAIAMTGAARAFVAKLVAVLDALVEHSGRAIAWLVVTLVAVTVWDVAMRYLFREGSVAAQEFEWHLFAAIFLLAGAYTLRHDGHVRVDILYRSARFGAGARRIVDILGIALFLLPFSILVIWASMPFVLDAWTHQEMSPDPGGLPYRWIAKALIPLGFGLLCVQGIADLLRLTVLHGGRE